VVLDARPGGLPGWVHPAVWALCLLPLLWLVWLTFAGGLGANPIEFVTHSTGTWALIGLLLTLSVTPLRQLTGWNAILPLRRTLGLVTFLYVCVHLLLWVVVDQFFDWPAMLADIVKRPYITAGFTGFLLLLPLAVTSTDAMRRRLGRRWARLHRLVYLLPPLVLLHYWWAVKKGVTEPWPYTLAAALLLGWRAVTWWRARATVSRV